MDKPEYYGLLDRKPFHVSGDLSVMNIDSVRVAKAMTPGFAALIRDALNALAGTPQPWQPEGKSGAQP